MNTHPTVELSPHSAEALRVLVEMMQDALSQHLAAEGPPPGEYEQGFADGYTIAITVVQAAAENCRRS